MCFIAQPVLKYFTGFSHAIMRHFATMAMTYDEYTTLAQHSCFVHLLFLVFNKAHFHGELVFNRTSYVFQMLYCSMLLLFSEFLHQDQSQQQLNDGMYALSYL